MSDLFTKMFHIQNKWNEMGEKGFNFVGIFYPGISILIQIQTTTTHN